MSCAIWLKEAFARRRAIGAIGSDIWFRQELKTGLYHVGCGISCEKIAMAVVDGGELMSGLLEGMLRG
jgi:hypothetical protein